MKVRLAATIVSAASIVALSTTPALASSHFPTSPSAERTSTSASAQLSDPTLPEPGSEPLFAAAPDLGTALDVLSTEKDDLDAKMATLTPEQNSFISKQMADMQGTDDPTPDPYIMHPQAAGSMKSRADGWMFSSSLPGFISLRASTFGNHSFSEYDWSSDGCSVPGWIKVAASWNRLFQNPCVRHDFGYRNYGPHSRLKLGSANYNDNRQHIDDNFRKDMDSVSHSAGDHVAAYAFWTAVRGAGGHWF